MNQLNHTHDASAQSWLTSANGHADFPIQNLPYAVFRRQDSLEAYRGGIAIGDQVLDLAALAQAALLPSVAQQAVDVCAQPTLNAFMAQGPAVWQALRHAVFALLNSNASASAQQAVRACLIAQDKVEYTLPTTVANYTDFYTSIHHARNVGRIARPEHDPLTPNFQWLPIAYHGRASSVVISGTDFHRPLGQAMPPGQAAPTYGPCQRLDYELELGFYVGQGNAMGQPISLAQAHDQLFGVCLLNDWSARDHQFWEMTPLGPFLGKNFCTSVSPWIVTTEALAPYRLPFTRPADEPQPLPYLDEACNRSQGAFDIQLTVSIDNAQHQLAHKSPSQLTATNFKHQYWTLAQMLAQHTVGGCNLLPGDLMGTGTISGPTPQEAGAMVELSKGGRETVLLKETKEERT
ncbi:MAG: fumarylacetoacetase, partial [Burkholderiaceae bacterium]